MDVPASPARTMELGPRITEDQERALADALAGGPRPVDQSVAR
ncbi:hypothetical protein [Streptomyces sp. NPDC050564]